MLVTHSQVLVVLESYSLYLFSHKMYDSEQTVIFISIIDICYVHSVYSGIDGNILTEKHVFLCFSLKLKHQSQLGVVLSGLQGELPPT